MSAAAQAHRRAGLAARSPRGRRLRILLSVTGLLVVAACDPGDPPESCPTCTIELEPVATIGPSELLLTYSKVVRTSDGGYVVGPIAHPGAVAVFDPDGTLRQTIGRLGEGPGELPSRFTQMFAWRGDSVAVPLGMRMMILAADGSGQRTVGVTGLLSGLATSGSRTYALYKPLLGTEEGPVVAWSDSSGVGGSCAVLP